MRRFVVLLALLGSLFAIAPATASAADFTGPHASMTREGFYTVTDNRYEVSRLYEVRWFGQHEDGSNMWHMFDADGMEFTASCQIMPGVDFDNYSDGGPAQIDCGVTAVAYATADPAEVPEPVKRKVFQIEHGFQNGMLDHMPYAPATMEPSPAPSSGPSQYERQQQAQDTFC